jgi:arginase
MNRVAVIGVPSSAGARRIGQELAPKSFRRAGFIERLCSAGLEVIDFGDLPEVSFRPDPQHPKQQNFALVFDVAQRVADQINIAVRQQLKPVVLGGDCTITLGVLAGLVSQFPNLGLIYFDGDIDLNTPSDTHSGIFDGMVLAHIIGKGAYKLTHIGHRYPLMPEENIILFGYNLDAGWMDIAETQRLEQCSMLKYPVSEVRGKASEASRKALSQLEDRAEQFLVHFDVDVIDFRDFPVADVPHEHGLSFSEAIEILKIFISNPKFAGLVITEFNAERDENGTLSRRFVNSVVRTLELGHIHW